MVVLNTMQHYYIHLQTFRLLRGHCIISLFRSHIGGSTVLLSEKLLLQIRGVNITGQNFNLNENEK